MPPANPAVMEFLLTRRSRPAKTLRAPAPDRDALIPILTAAARTPDHGKLEPWRFIVLQGDALHRLAALAVTRGTAMGQDPEKIEKLRLTFEQAPLVVAVVFSPKPSEKVPQIEQEYSAGAACLGLLNAALASGWGANWLSSWAAFDAPFLQEGLGLEAPDSVAGFIHIGTETSAPPERPRPDIAAITTWVDA